MSERKSAEIKFRCTPSFKASLAASASDSSQSMSEYIEVAVASWQNMCTRVSEIVTEAPEPDSADDEFDSDDIVAVAATSIDEPPVDDDPATWCLCRPWEFCTHKATG